MIIILIVLGWNLFAQQIELFYARLLRLRVECCRIEYILFIDLTKVEYVG